MILFDENQYKNTSKSVGVKLGCYVDLGMLCRLFIDI